MESREGTCSVKEFAKMIHLSEKTIYKRIKEGILPTCSRISRDIRISRATVHDILSGRLSLWFGEQTRPGLQPPTNEAPERLSAVPEPPRVSLLKPKGGRIRAKKQPPGAGSE